MRPSLGSSIDDRTFYQKFGKTCFCGKNWSDGGRCGDPDPNFSMDKMLSALFAGNGKGKAGPPKDCETCGKPTFSSRHRFCEDCGAARARTNRNRTVEDECARCGTIFSRRADRKDRTLCTKCSRSKPICKRGHVIAEVGRYRHECRQCRRDRAKGILNEEG